MEVPGNAHPQVRVGVGRVIVVDVETVGIEVTDVDAIAVGVQGLPVFARGTEELEPYRP